MMAFAYFIIYKFKYLLLYHLIHMLTVIVMDWASLGTKLEVHVRGPSWFFKILVIWFLEDLLSLSFGRGMLGELMYPFDFPVLPGKITSQVLFTTGSPSVKTTQKKKHIKLMSVKRLIYYIRSHVSLSSNKNQHINNNNNVHQSRYFFKF